MDMPLPFVLGCLHVGIEMSPGMLPGRSGVPQWREARLAQGKFFVLGAEIH